MLNAAFLRSEIEDRFKREENKLIAALDAVKYVCVTVDNWTTRNGTFLGSTLHWLEPVSLQRKSAPFIRRRMKSNKLNVNEIAEQITSMCEKYRIVNKILGFNTYNGWNNGQAFKEFGVMAHQNTAFCEFNKISFDSRFPSQNRCVSVTQMLSQIATTDAAGALTDDSYREIHSSVFEKLNHFWQKSYESPAESDDIVRPTDGRCNSLFDSLQFIVNKGVGVINVRHIQLGVPTLSLHDQTFLVEFTQIAKPIATAIDHLAKSDCYFAAFMPTIYTIDHAFQKLMVKEFELCRPLLQAMYAGFRRRFNYCFVLDGNQCESALLATCTHPFFKTRWLSPNHAMGKHIIDIVTNAVKKEMLSQTSDGEGLNGKSDILRVTSVAHLLGISRSITDATDAMDTNVETDDFEYYFASDDNTKATTQKLQIDEAASSEVHSFFDSPCEKDKNNLEQLDLHKMVRKVFIKYNTILPSSAPVERIFGFERKWLRSTHLRHSVSFLEKCFRYFSPSRNDCGDPAEQFRRRFIGDDVLAQGARTQRIMDEFDCLKNYPFTDSDYMRPLISKTAFCFNHLFLKIIYCLNSYNSFLDVRVKCDREHILIFYFPRYNFV